MAITPTLTVPPLDTGAATLYGRERETGLVNELLETARGRRSRALVIRGVTGIGKSAMLEYAGATSGDLRVLRATGIEDEAELPYSHLLMLLRPVLNHVNALPERQAKVLGGCLGVASEAGGDRFTMSLAVLNLLASVAEDSPVLCLIDDAHWIDRESAEVLLFVARRLEAEGIAMLFAARHLHAPEFAAQGVEELFLDTLDNADAARMLARQASDLPEQTRLQLISEADGNPLALRELPVAQREGRLTLDPYRVSPLPTHSRIKGTFADQISDLPKTTRTLLLAAAAHGSCESPRILQAAQQLGATMADLGLAESKQLISIVDGRVCFRHPLIRSAAYQYVSGAERMTMHRVLAQLCSTPAEAERRAWHLAAAATAPDKTVANALEHVARSGQARGGRNAVAAAFERSAQLSPDPLPRAWRFRWAASAALAAGQFERVTALSKEAGINTTDPKLLGEIANIQASVTYRQGRLMAAHDTWVTAASEVAPHSSGQASYMLFQAVQAAWMAGDFGALDQAASMSAALNLSNTELVRSMARVANGLSNREGDVADGVAALKDLVGKSHCGDEPTLDARATLAWWHMLLGDHTTALDLTERLVHDCRDTGALGLLPRALALRSKAQLYAGLHRDAAASANEGLRLAQDFSDNPIMIGVPMSTLSYLAAIEGDERRCRDLVSHSPIDEDNSGIMLLEGALGVLDLALGRNESAVDRLSKLAARRNRMDILPTVPDLVEAAVRSGQAERAQEPFAWLATWAEHVGHNWAAAVVQRSRALLGPVGQTEAHFVRAIELHNEPGDRPFERARTELLFGEWLRRARRSAEARGHLRAALDVFAQLEVTPWARRARAELRAAGDSDGRPARDTGVVSRLTPQELQVVRLAASGMTNRDIGAQLFLSPRTVGYHLYKAYPKLNISNRGELAGLDLANKPS